MADKIKANVINKIFAANTNKAIVIDEVIAVDKAILIEEGIAVQEDILDDATNEAIVANERPMKPMRRQRGR